MLGDGQGWIRRLLSWLAPHKRNVALAFGASVLGTGVAGVTPLIQKAVIDDLDSGRNRSVAPFLGLLVLAGIARFALAYVRRYSAGRIGVDVQYDLRTALFRTVQRLDFASHDALQTGQLVTRAGTDVNLLQGLLGFLPMVIGNLMLFVVAFVAMIRLSPLLTLVTLSTVPFLAFFTMRVRKTIFPASWDASQQAGVVAGIVDEAVTGVRVVKGFGQEERELNRLAGAASDLLAKRIRLLRLQARLQPTLQTIPALGQVAVLGFGGWLAIHDRISLGTFLAFNVYVTQLMAPVRMAAMLIAFGQQARASVERIAEILDANPLVADADTARPLPVPHGEVVFDGVTFGYLRSEPVLRDFSLTVAPGETVALVGTSGSGKSTVALLLPRFYDVHEGAVRVDGTDIREATVDSLRENVGVVFEDPFLFSDTIRSNIAYGKPDATDAEVETAARAAEAHGFIAAMAEGYDTVVGEQGLTLSGGQRQRIALARALITDPKLLVLDDATSAVDSRVEEEILATLEVLLHGRTTLLVAHRRSTLRLADRIAVVDKGTIVDVGTEAELEARCPLFRLLLSGPGDDAEAADADEHVDAVAADGWSPGLVTPTLWVPRDDVSAREALAAAGRLQAGGGGHGDWGGASMSATPELLAKVEALPPANDRPDVTVAEMDEPGAGFAFWSYLRRWRWGLGAGLGLVALDATSSLLGPTIIRFGVDSGIRPERTDRLWLAVAAALAVALAACVVTIAEILVTGKVAERALYGLRVRVFGHLQRLSLDYYDREMAGRVMTRMTTDIDALQQLLQTGLVSALVSLLSCAGVGIALTVMNPQLALITALVVPPLAVATWLYRSRARSAYDDAREHVAAVNADFQENLSGVRVAQAFGREGRNEARFETLADRYRRSRVRAQRLVALYFPFVEMLSEVAVALVLGAGAGLVRDGSLDLGELIAFLLFLGLFFAPLQQLSAIFDTWQQARTSINRIQELLATPTTTPAAADPLPVGRLSGAIELRDVGFRYGSAPAGEAALDGASLTIAPRETVAFVGETGAGKSTVLKLVARYYDVTSGAVLVDGHDVRDLDLSAFRAQLGIVPQEPYLFAGTIRDNIAYGRPDATDAEVEAASRAVGAHDIVATLPGGYFHIVGERGRSLSAGQRQLLALARALLVDPAILLLDEATANLDLATEARVAAAMGAAAHDRTTLLIAHRLPTAAVADRIVVLDAGRVAEVGTHLELLAGGGLYTRLWAAFEGAPAA